jgi:hypothetical protein
MSVLKMISEKVSGHRLDTPILLGNGIQAIA